jgi:hypothetical protein
MREHGLIDQKIMSIERGYGEDSTYFSTEDRLDDNSPYKVDKIVPYEKFVGKGYHNDLTQLVYQCWKNGRVIAELDTQNLTIKYYNQGKPELLNEKQ